MIGYLSGKVVGRINSQVIIKTPSGVGYLVGVSPTVNIMTNENLELYIFEVRREDRSDLYGFTNLKDREWVDNLLKVGGVGPKMAATIIYTLGWEQLLEAIRSEDSTLISSVKGLGLKTAKKIVLELKGDQTDIKRMESVSLNDKTVSEFAEALTSLGYKKSEVVGLISQMKKDGVWEEGDIVEMIKVGLRYFNKS